MSASQPASGTAAAADASESPPRSHTLVVLLRDRPSVLHRTITLFRRRDYNIASLTVGPSESPDVSRMTVVVDSADVHQVVKQLTRLIDVLYVTDVTSLPSVVRETALVKVDVTAASRGKLQEFATRYGARIADESSSTVVLEIMDEPQAIEKFISEARPFGLREVARSGHLAMMRGPRTESKDGRPAPFHYQADGMASPHSREN